MRPVLLTSKVVSEKVKAFKTRGSGTGGAAQIGGKVYNELIEGLRWQEDGDAGRSVESGSGVPGWLRTAIIASYELAANLR